MTTTAQLAAARERRRAAFAYSRKQAPAPLAHGQGFVPLPVRVVEPIVVSEPQAETSDIYGQIQMFRRFIEFVVWLADEAEEAAMTGAFAKRITIARIQEETSAYFKVGIKDLKGPRRYRQLVYQRQVSMYLCKTMTEQSFPAIGQRFGGRDHTTVLHGYHKIAKLLEQGDENVSFDVHALTVAIENGW